MLDRLIESATNRLLAMDPSASDKIVALSGKTMDLVVTGFPDPARFTFTSTGVEVDRVTTDVAAHAADATLSGSPFAFARAFMGSDAQAAMTAGVKVDGDVEFAQQFSALMGELDIDFEDEIAHYIGNAPAYGLSRLLRKGRDFVTQGSQRVQDNVGEFLREDSEQLADGDEINTFMNDVDDLRASVDAIERRIDALAINKVS